MRKFSWLLLALPLVELYLLIKIGAKVGALTMVLWVVLSILLGAFLIRNAGVATAVLVRERLARGERPDAQMLTGFMWVIAGVLLILPGPLTDLAGLLCLLPVTRNLLVKRLQRGFVAGGSFYHRQDSSVIEGEYSRKQDDHQLR